MIIDFCVYMCVRCRRRGSIGGCIACDLLASLQLRFFRLLQWALGE